MKGVNLQFTKVLNICSMFTVSSINFFYFFLVGGGGFQFNANSRQISAAPALTFLNSLQRVLSPFLLLIDAWVHCCLPILKTFATKDI